MATFLTDNLKQDFFVKIKYLPSFILMGCLIVFASYLSVSAKVPTIYSPFCILSFLPTAILPSLLSSLLMAAIYLIWSFPLIKGQTKIPPRTDILSIISITLSCVFLIRGWHLGIQYQGIYHVMIMCFFNVIFWLILLLVYFR